MTEVSLENQVAQEIRFSHPNTGELSQAALLAAVVTLP